ncbi:hypothetical protein [uncultured Agrobacterium sp.]|uniref:hypothetical protein n=1 Tax=uncultured Agrobacterium sp. TaxID=157277 RepID=UPI0025DE8165|nr:hypothetical protein [uncultured Agrobacterium sp.]
MIDSGASGENKLRIPFSGCHRKRQRFQKAGCMIVSFPAGRKWRLKEKRSRRFFDAFMTVKSKVTAPDDPVFACNGPSECLPEMSEPDRASSLSG